MTNILSSENYLETTDLVREPQEVEVDLAAGGWLMRGDVLSHNNRLFTVTSVKVGTKWVYASVEERKSPVEILADETITVTRMVPTKESVDALEREKANYKYAVRIEDSRKVLEHAAEAVAKTMADGGFLDYSTIDTLLAGNAKARVWAQFAEFAKIQAEREEDPARDLVDAHQRFTVVLTKRLISNYEMTRALSKSTSVVSNLMSDVEREATAKFVEDSRWDY